MCTCMVEGGAYLPGQCESLGSNSGVVLYHLPPSLVYLLVCARTCQAPLHVYQMGMQVPLEARKGR